MPPFNLAVGLSFAAQTIGAVVMSLLLYAFYRQYRKEYLLHWTLGWTAMTVFHVSTSAAFMLRQTFDAPADSPGRIFFATLSGVASYMQIGWLLFGVYQIVNHRPVRIATAQRTLVGLAAAGLLTSLLFSSEDWSSLVRYATRVGLRSGVTAVVFAVASVALWRASRRRKGISFVVLSLAFGAYAAEELHYALTAVRGLMTAQLDVYMAYLGYVDFLLQSVIAVGMISCVLEDEREAADYAAAEIEHLAYYDALTGLPNRPLFMDRLRMAIENTHRTDQKLALFFLDLDRFKDINDSLGHSLGDALLKGVAERIRGCVRSGDTVARFGGDEFTLLVPRIDNVEDAAKIGQKIIETLKIPFVVGERELFVTTSIGVTIYPSDGGDAETLVRNADSAMYRAKEYGRDNCQLYAPAMNAQALERLALENALRKALSQHELALYYQPLVEARTGAMIGVEALVRWLHPELGLLAPIHFIGAAEKSGLIVPIGEWILRTACKQLRAWHRKVDRDLTMSVNLSARQFQQPDLVDVVRAAITESGIPPSSLTLEITESNAMQNAENTIHALRELKSLGVSIAMDDFGTGYSSLNYLKRFPIDTLKLDKMFVQDVASDPSDAAIVSAVITMAHSLRLKVVAEGVETQAQLEFLRAERCDVIQGYFFSQPLPVDQLERFAEQPKSGTYT